MFSSLKPCTITALTVHLFPNCFRLMFLDDRLITLLKVHVHVIIQRKLIAYMNAHKTNVLINM